MKKILLTAFVLLIAAGAKAQVGGTPRELTCTEEAFTFKANIGSGWHLSQFTMGPPETAKIVTAYSPDRVFKSDGVKQEAPAAPSFISSLRSTGLLHVANLYMPAGSTASNSTDFRFNKLYYVIPYSHDFWQLNSSGATINGL